MTIPPARQTRVLTIADVADHLQVCSKTVRRWVNAGELPAHRLGRQLRVAEHDLRAFWAQRRQ